MKRKESPGLNSGRRSLISTRTNQQQQRKMQNPNARSLLPRSYSSPGSQNDSERSQQSVKNDFIMRSFSSPESKHSDYRRNSESFFRPKIHGSRSELDSDLENFEQFEECLIDMDADEDVIIDYQRSEKEEPRKVIASMLPGSGLQKVYIRPIAASGTQSLYNAREAMKRMQKEDNKGTSRLNFRPLVVKMPTRHQMQPEEPPSQEVEELQTSPQLEMESEELDREMDSAEHHLERGVSIATEESDADTFQKQQEPNHPYLPVHYREF